MSKPEPPFRRLARTPTIWIVGAVGAVLRVAFRHATARDRGEDQAQRVLEPARRRRDPERGDPRGRPADPGEARRTAPTTWSRIRPRAPTRSRPSSRKPACRPRRSRRSRTRSSGLLYYVLPILLLAGLFLWMMNRAQGGGGRVMQFGRSRHKTVGKDQPKTTFKDVAGVDEAIEELEEVKEYLQHPAKFQAMGAKIPRGVLLFGPPGTGKTLLARAVAGEAGVPFFSISGSDFVEMFVGVGAARVRDLFEQAKASAPGDRLRRRDRRRRPPSRGGARRRTRRARADPESAARGDGRVRPADHGDPDGRDQPARHPGPRAPASRPLRPADRRRPAGPGGTEGHPPRPRARASRSIPARTSTSSPGAPPASPAPTSPT